MKTKKAGRPKKNNADYFNLPSDLHNNPVVSDLRRELGDAGFTIYIMAMSVLSNSDYFKYEFKTEQNQMYFAAMVGKSVEDVIRVIDWGIKWKCFSIEEGFLYSPSLNSQMQVLIQDRANNRGQEYLQNLPKPDKKGSQLTNPVRGENFVAAPVKPLHVEVFVNNYKTVTEASGKIREDTKDGFSDTTGEKLVMKGGKEKALIEKENLQNLLKEKVEKLKKARHEAGTPMSEDELDVMRNNYRAVMDKTGFIDRVVENGIDEIELNKLENLTAAELFDEASKLWQSEQVSGEEDLLNAIHQINLCKQKYPSMGKMFFRKVRRRVVSWESTSPRLRPSIYAIVREVVKECQNRLSVGN